MAYRDDATGRLRDSAGTTRDKLKRNRLKELIDKRYYKNMNLAMNSAAPSLANKFYYGMIAFTIIFALSEVFNVLKARDGGSDVTYSFALSVNAAFYVWTAVGIVVLIIGAFAWKDLSGKLKDHSKIQIIPPREDAKTIGVRDVLEDPEHRELIMREAVKEIQEQFDKLKKHLIVTAAGIAVLGAAYAVCRFL